MGAIAANDICILNETLINQLHISKSDIEVVKEAEKTELARRNKNYRQGHPFPSLSDKTVILGFVE